VTKQHSRPPNSISETEQQLKTTALAEFLMDLKVDKAPKPLAHFGKILISFRN